ncbi:DMT family transporter [Amylibacter sp.]|nr:DMT family transporter [Amylibacter sp.]MDA9781169.1 DMT family transporter [Amylibacter sp.]MDB4095689.1 DMT family transporter [Amylibacter sp.]MDC0565161.1 DMT family transporter [Amylibacter sp.]
MQQSENIRGAIYMCLSMAGFVLNDAVIKYASADIGMYQSIFVRGCFAVIIIGIACIYNGAFKIIPNRLDHKLIIWRTLAEIFATITFLTALFYLPIANITALLQALPLTVTLAASWFLGEKIGWRRGVAILIGFIGVLLIIQPGTDEFNVYSILGIFCVIFVTIRDLVVRKFSAKISTLYVAFITAAAIALVGGFLTFAYEGWIPMKLHEVILLFIASTLIFVGYFFAISAMRSGQVSFVSPFRYTIMIWAIILGYLIWGDIPNNLTLLGISIVIGMGIFTFWREAQLKN